MLTHKKYHILALIFILILQICSLPKDDKVINPPVNIRFLCRV